VLGLRPKTAATLGAATFAAALVLGACRGEAAKAKPAPKPFCEAAAKLDERLAEAGAAEQVRLLERVVEVAPAQVKGAAQTFLDGLRRVQADPSVRRDRRYEDAASALERYAIDRCGLLEQQRGGVPL